MKKAILSSLLAVGILSVSAGTVLAGPNDTATKATTEGEVSFEVDDKDGPTIKPGTDGEDKENELLPGDGGGVSKGELRLQHVPSFRFETIKLDGRSQKANAFLEPVKVAPNGSNQDGFIPHFVQVVDIRGKGAAGDGYVVKVEQEAAFDNGAGHTLKDTRIHLKEEAFFNNIPGFAANLVGLGSAGAIADGAGVIGVAGVSGDTAATVLSTKAGTTVDSSYSSLVFNKDYTEADDLVANKATDLNTGVEIQVPSTDNAVADSTYTTTLVWTLENVAN